MEEKAGKTTSEIIGNNPKPPKKQLPDLVDFSSLSNILKMFWFYQMFLPVASLFLAGPRRAFGANYIRKTNGALPSSVG
jgi:hypothetical protein